VSAGRKQRRNRFREEERIDVLMFQFAVLEGMQKSHVRCAARTEGLHCKGVEAIPTQMVEQQSGQQCFADAGIGAGDKDEPMFHGR